MLTATRKPTPKLADATGLRSSLRAFEPTRHVRCLEWAREHIVNDQGRPYDHSAYPHIGAPGGPMDALDDFRVREISLQWATRLGKSFFGQVAMIKAMECGPAPAMFVSSTEKLARDITTRTYQMMRQRRPLRELLVRPERFQRQDLIETRGMKMFVAWARSASTLADKNVKFGHANEIDKWEHTSTAKEADPLKLFTDRFKDYQAHRKLIFESTPTVRGSSRIEQRLLSGTNCRFWVPCPHCKRYQALEMGGEETVHGLKWDRRPDGASDSTTARATARYVCRHCEGEIGDFQRSWIMRRGVWCPEGAEVDDEAALSTVEGTNKHEWRGWKNAAWIKGTPHRDGVEASYQLSSLYALSLSWGDIAAEFIDSRRRPQILRNFVNQWLGETWQSRRVSHTWETLGRRLAGNYRRGTVPDECGIITLGIDVQDQFFVYVLVGWGPDDRGYVVDYGEVLTWGEMRAQVLATRVPGISFVPLPIAMGGIDSGHRTSEVYGYCQEIGDALRPTKGVDSLEKPIIASSMEGSRSPTRRAQALAAQMYLYKFDKGYWHEELQRRLDSLESGQPGSLTIPKNCESDQDFLEQILNNAPEETESGKRIWKKVHESMPDDYRDALVIARVVKEMWCRGNDNRVNMATSVRRRAVDRPKRVNPDEETELSTEQPRFLDRPGGWIKGMR